jgi:hypothetical protein
VRVALFEAVDDADGLVVVLERPGFRDDSRRELEFRILPPEQRVEDRFPGVPEGRVPEIVASSVWVRRVRK